jgi:hypothetical protein
LAKIKGVQSVVVDTTARGFFRSSRDEKALHADAKAALKDSSLKLKTFGAAKLGKPSVVYHIDIDGLG